MIIKKKTGQIIFASKIILSKPTTNQDATTLNSHPRGTKCKRPFFVIICHKYLSIYLSPRITRNYPGRAATRKASDTHKHAAERADPNI